MRFQFLLKIFTTCMIDATALKVVGSSMIDEHIMDGDFVVVHGKQTHGAFPSGGVDPIVIGAQIVIGIQTIVSRQINLSTAPAVVTVGAFQGGLRENIIPDSAWMIGTIRTYDESMRKTIHERLSRTAESIAQGSGATATVTVTRGYDVTVNNADLVALVHERQYTEAVADVLPDVPGLQNVLYLEDGGDPSILSEGLREMADDVFEEDDEDPNGAWNDTSAELH